MEIFIEHQGQRSKLLSITKEKAWKVAARYVFNTVNKRYILTDNFRFVYNCGKCGKELSASRADNHTRYKIIRNQFNPLCSVCAAIGVKRTDAFKETQRKNAINQFKDPNQRKTRSKRMKRSWAEGNIVSHLKTFSSTSKQERKFFEELQKICPFKIEKKAIHIQDKWILPDVVVADRIIFEYYGDYWHANPNRFEMSDIVHHKIIAKDIWDRDEKRVKLLEDNGYIVYIVWQHDWHSNKEKILKDISIMFNWDDECTL